VLRADGSVEALFGNNGVTLDPFDLDPTATAVWRTPDGGLLGLGQDSTSASHYCLWRASGRIEACNSLADGGSFFAPDGSLYQTGVLADASQLGKQKIAIWRYSLAAPNVEYFNSILGHYFVTYDGTEARMIDQGIAGPGWSRTGQSFKTGGTTPVCRFYGTPGIGSNSHFFTINADECELVKKDPGWTFEGYGFYATPAVNGQCEAPLVPVYRLYNQRAAQRDSNHRHITDLSLAPAMQAAGWALEGVAMCVRP
jgi:hypothetical protein